MAIPFGPYEGQDLTSYQEGNKFLPRQFYSLNTTPATELASTIGNTGGVTNTSAAYPYIWPPQGGGGGGGGGFSNTNKFGLNLDTQKTIDMGKWQEAGGPANMYPGTYVKTSRNIAQDEHGNWKDINTNKNVYHGNINVETPMTMLLNKFTGKKTTHDPYAGTWSGAEWDEEFDPTVAGKNLNVIQRWKAKREFKAAQEQKAAADQVRADITAHKPYLQYQSEQNKAANTGGWQSGMAKDEGFMSGAGTSDEMGSFAQGGRIGYRTAGPVFGHDEPSEPISEFMQDQNIPFSEQVEGDPFEMRIQELMGKGLSYDDAYDIAAQEFQDLFSERSEQDQGIASLV